MGFADLHIHSIHSYDGTSTIPAILKHVSEKTNLDVIAITDHDNIDGVNQAVALAPEYGLHVIPGCEVTSSEGHVLALFIRKLVPAGLSFLETLSLIGEQGGLAIAAHPEAKGTNSLKFEAIRKACNDPFASQILVGVETFNGGLVYARSNITAKIQSTRLSLAQLGNSDAHILSMIGSGTTYFPGNSIKDLRTALNQRLTRVASSTNMGGIHVLTSYLPRYLLRLSGWAVWNENPSKPLKLARINQLNPQPSNQIGRLLHQMIYEY